MNCLLKAIPLLLLAANPLWAAGSSLMTSKEMVELVPDLTRGFLNVDQLGLPPAIARSVEEVLAATPAGTG